ncbi:MAG TPA: hypothetical protein VLF95_06330 [Vicinamibacteria bacterium]|nr:hypothetical protein [Vicinamibacteria bacterium]
MKTLTIESDPIPLSEVEMAWTREVDGVRTALAIVGGVALTLAALEAISLRDR